MKGEYPKERDIFEQAAKQLFHSEVQRLKQKNADDEVSLNARQIKQLTAKIRILPEDWQNALLLCYGCGFDAKLTGDLLDNPDVSDEILYAKDTLALAMKVPGIARESLAKSCRIVLQNFHKQVKLEQQDNPISTRKKLNKKIQRMIREQSKVKHISFYVVVKRAAVLFLALLVASTITVLSVEAFRNKFFDWLFSFFPTHTRVEFVDVIPSSDMDDTSQLNQYAPTYIPEGFTLVDIYESDQRYKLFYEKDTGERIIFEVRTVKDQNHTNVNTENNEMEEIIVNGETGYYINCEPGHIIFWSDELYFFNIICETSKNDAIKIAESTKAK